MDQYHFVVETNETIVLGNAFDSTMQDLWTGKLMTEYRKIHTEDRRQMPICKNCEECSKPKDNSKPFHHTSFSTPNEPSIYQKFDIHNCRNWLQSRR